MLSWTAFSHSFIFLFFSTRSIQTGCLGCATGKGAGPLNIFGNKYGQNLAAVQIARERRMEAKRLREEQQAKEQEEQQQAKSAANNGDSDGDEETDDDTDDEDDFGPSPAAGIWAGSQKLQAETEKIAEEKAGEDNDEDDGDDEQQPAAKKIKT